MSTSALLASDKDFASNEDGDPKCCHGDGEAIDVSRSSSSTSTSSINNDRLIVQPTPVNESWRLCMEHKWMALQMRLGMFPEEARRVQPSTKRSLLHEVVTATPISSKTTTESCSSAVSSSSSTKARIIPNEDHLAISVVSPRCEEQTNERSVGNDKYNDQSSNIDADLMTLLILRSVYFSCPQAMLLQDSLMSYTPLHGALVAASSTASISSSSTTRNIINTRQKHDTNKSTSAIASFDLIQTLIDLCLGRCNNAVYHCNDDDEFDGTDSLSFEDEDENEEEQEQVDNEESVLLIRDFLGDTPLHTACRHGCNKSILMTLMKACPSALFQYNTDAMTPLRLLWNKLEQDYTLADVQKTDKSVPSATITSSNQMKRHRNLLEEIVSTKIHSYNDLQKTFPSIHDTWEKSIMLLHLYEFSASAVTDDQTSGSASLDDNNLEDNDAISTNTKYNKNNNCSTSEVFELPQSMTYNQICGLIYGAPMDDLMSMLPSKADQAEANNIYGNFLNRTPYIIGKDYPTSEWQKDAGFQYPQAILQPMKQVATTTIAADSTRTNLNILKYPTHHPLTSSSKVQEEKKRKHSSLHDVIEHHHNSNPTTSNTSSSPRSNSNSDANSNSSTNSSRHIPFVEVKGIEPDENGIIPMPSYKSTTYFQKREDIHTYDVVEETNFFFEQENA